MKIRSGDTVRVMAGKDAGREGKIARVFPDRNKVIVEGVNTARKHQRATGETMQGGIIDKDMPIDVSNVMIMCASCDGPTRIASRFDSDGNKLRICRRCGEDL
ncbi:MAG: 50S ribosomal protein L24 [Acidimicrobiia bacterium]|nr:50S ribosomal protein L24 [Acidimicrobiia bacterium]NNC74366.1 50S ribosomal protein L24 [Acidimicrobiia bacterium]